MSLPDAGTHSPTDTDVSPPSEEVASEVPRRHDLALVDAAALREHVAPYLAGALHDDAPAVAVASNESLRHLRAALTDAGIDLRTAPFMGVPAEDLLATFMIEGCPDPVRFRQAVGGMIERSPTGPRPGRYYGEMVSVLWQQGNVAAVLALEQLWADLAATHDFDLVCGYHGDLPASDEERELFDEQVRGHHTAVLATEVPSFSRDRSDGEPDLDGDEPLTRREVDEIVARWATRHQLAQETLHRIRRANEQVYEQLQEARGRIRALEDRVRALRAQLESVGRQSLS